MVALYGCTCLCLKKVLYISIHCFHTFGFIFIDTNSEEAQLASSCRNYCWLENTSINCASKAEHIVNKRNKRRKLNANNHSVALKKLEEGIIRNCRNSNSVSLKA